VTAPGAAAGPVTLPTSGSRWLPGP
jgi:hypothetical protein